MNRSVSQEMKSTFQKPASSAGPKERGGTKKKGIQPNAVRTRVKIKLSGISRKPGEKIPIYRSLLKVSKVSPTRKKWECDANSREKAGGGGKLKGGGQAPFTQSRSAQEGSRNSGGNGNRGCSLSSRKGRKIVWREQGGRN